MRTAGGSIVLSPFRVYVQNKGEGLLVGGCFFFKFSHGSAQIS